MNGLDSGQWMQGPLLRRISVIALRMSALAMVIGALVFSCFGWALIWRVGWFADLPRLVFALMLVQLLFVIGITFATRLLWRRARWLHSAAEAPYHALPIVSTLLALTGELGALFMLTMGSGMAVVMVVAGEDLVSRVPEIAGFVDLAPVLLRWLLYLMVALASLLAALLGAWFFLLGAYFFAEWFEVMVDIAVQARAIRESQGRNKPPDNPVKRKT